MARGRRDTSSLVRPLRIRSMSLERETERLVKAMTIRKMTPK